jgi:DNA polymerase-4
MNDSDRLNWLFLDLNAYFASVEQQERPELRGQPVAVLPVMTDSTSCIAASYEAKAFGIRTGSGVGEARALCPGLRLVEARQDVYVDYHHRILDAVDSCIPVDSVLSIDELICSLSGPQREPAEAITLARKIKQTIYDKVGRSLRCSVGLAPNRFLAKVAGDMQKPDGLTVLPPSELPQRLFPMAVRELPGIGEQMEARLHTVGIRTVRQLCALSVEEMRRLWGGITGERLWGWLRGEEPPMPPSHRHSIGHSHVLAPENRTASGLYRVAKRLTSRAAVRLRKEHFWSSGMTLSVRFTDKSLWESRGRFEEAQDTPRFLKVLDELWADVPKKSPMWVAVGLHPLIADDHHHPSLFHNPKQDKLSAVMDKINETYGKDTAYFASLQDSLKQAPTRIAFSRIPDASEF